VRHLRAIWLVVSRAVRVSPWQSAVCLLETLGSFVVMLEPLFVTWLVVGAVRHDRSMLIWAVTAFVFSLTVNLFLTIVGNNARITQYERVGFWFDTEVSRLTSSLTTLEHLQSPEYLDRTQVLQDQQGLLGFAFNSVLNLMRNLVLAGGTLVLALVADPRMLLVVLAGIPAVASTRWTTRWQSAMDKASAEPSRRAKHLLGLSVDAGSGAELRVFGAQSWSRSATERATRGWLDLRAANTVRQSVLQSACTAFFFVVGTLVLAWLLHDTIAGNLGVSQFVLAATLTTRLQEVAGRLQWAANFLVRVSDNGGRYLWLESFARNDAASHTGLLTPPDRLSHGITTVGLGYTYPGAELPTLDEVTLDLPAGAVVALVGENGAGKSTLVGLLTGMLRPTEGRVLVDGVDLVDFDHTRWRARMSGAFQDYARLELTAQQSIGVGDVALIEEPDAALAALDRASATDVLAALPRGLPTQLGTRWEDGVELSSGQWQRLAIARGMMREEPLLLVLDEPTAALDAGTEHALFDRYADAARRAGGRGGVTLLVTHRFSTVASADLVVVLNQGRVVEVGTHNELHSRGGHYTELYELQARGYR
jgi:ATP-binding cassette, subfamily B, bacterial